MPAKNQRLSVFVLFTVLLVHAGWTVNAVGEDLLVASEGSPKYQLSKLRIESDRFGRSLLVVDYQLKSKGESGHGNVTVSGKTKNGPLRVVGVTPLDDSGELNISVHSFGFSAANDFELYFVIDGHSKTPQLVSNVVRLGDPGPATKARAWTAEEKATAAKQKLFAKPPESLPDGYLATTQATRLVPGMPVKAGYYGEWADAEIISFKVGGDVTLRYDSEDRLQPHPRAKWIAISPEVLAKAETNPDQFNPSVRALPDSSLIIPDGAIALPDELALVPGTPLLTDHHSRWKDVYVINATDHEVELRHKNFGPNWDETQPRSKLIITQRTIEQLQDPTSVSKFAVNIALKKPRSGSGFPSKNNSRSKIRHKSYPIDIRLPDEASLVPDDLKVKKGTALAACWANKWQPLTAMYENEDGSIHVHWNDRSDAFDCNMTRDQLVIEDKTIDKLRREEKRSKKSITQPESAAAGSETELSETLRTWTDATGKYKTEAWYVEHDDRQVTLKTAAGREIRMPLNKLSESDQQLLSELSSELESDNPFAQ